MAGILDGLREVREIRKEDKARNINKDLQVVARENERFIESYTQFTQSFENYFDYVLGSLGLSRVVFKPKKQEDIANTKKMMEEPEFNIRYEMRDLGGGQFEVSYRQIDLTVQQQASQVEEQLNS